MTEEAEKELYLNNYKRKSFQWELWSYCLNKCVFCYLGVENKNTLEARQLTSLNDFIGAIDNLDFNIYNNISLIGGEFFQGECHSKEVEKKLFEALKKVTDLYKNKKIGSSWITVTLTKKKQNILYEFLNYLKDNKLFGPNEKYGSSGLWFCTSWDTKGRFHTQEYKDNWEYHMLKIQNDYPFVKFNTTCILTEAFLLDYIENRFSFKDFQEKYKTTIFLKQSGLGTNFSPESIIGNKRVSNEEYGKLYEEGKKRANEFYGFNFFPRREVMLEFLKKVYLEDYDIYDRLFNIKYRADELHRNFNTEEHDRKDERYKNSINETSEVSSEYLNTCGHIFNYACYCDNMKCCICDKNYIKDLL